MNFYNAKFNRKRIDLKITHEDEKKIELLVGKYLSKDNNESSKAFFELSNYGRTAMPVVIKEFLKLKGTEADRVEGVLMSFCLGDVPVRMSDPLDTRKKIWIGYYDKNNSDGQ